MYVPRPLSGRREEAGFKSFGWRFFPQGHAKDYGQHFYYTNDPIVRIFLCRFWKERCLFPGEGDAGSCIPCVDQCTIFTLQLPLNALSRPQVVSIESFLTDVIRYSADVTQEHELYTLEDGLDLWLAVQ